MSAAISEALAFCRKYLPAQGPAEFFAHHNPLHSFEDSPFFEALQKAQNLYAANAHPSLAWYREQYNTGRILDADLKWVLQKRFADKTPSSESSNPIFETVRKCLFSDINQLETTLSPEAKSLLEAISFQPKKRELNFLRIATPIDNALSESERASLNSEVRDLLSTFFTSSLNEASSDEKGQSLLAKFLKSNPESYPLSWASELKQSIESVASLPHSPFAVIERTLSELKVPEPYLNSYLFQTLLGIREWSALCLDFETYPLHNTTPTKVDFESLVAIALLIQAALHKHLSSRIDPSAYQEISVPSSANKHSEESRTSFYEQTLFEIWHEAYEIHLVSQAAAALQEEPLKSTPNTTPRFQVITCIDDREESLRRHLEEISEEVETFGVAGHFGLQFLYKGKHDTHYRASCKTATPPPHIAWEESDSTLPINYCQEDRSDDKQGYTEADMADAVENLLRTIGLTTHFANIIYVCGHGSSDTNHPDEHLLHCSACGGARGESNARIVAHMANRKGVRALLAKRGLLIPSSTQFVSGYHNTCTDSLIHYDLSEKTTAQAHWAEFEAILQEASLRNAKERTRRFHHIPFSTTPQEAKAQLEQNALNHTQSPSEYGHVSHAICLVGKRTASRQKFLDRRAFLASYDATQDPQHETLHSLFQLLIPVCSSINMSYYFSRVDADLFGSNSDSPPAISSSFDTVNNSKDRLHLGIPWSIARIHEPTRITLFIEASREALLEVLSHGGKAADLVRNEWVRLAVIENERSIYLYSKGTFIPFEALHDTPVIHTASSLERIANSRSRLDFSVIDS